MKALILAGGEGKRVRPFTHTRPKAMVYVAGKPLLYWIIEELKKAGINEFYVVVQHHKEKILEYFNGWKNICFLEQGKEYGTAKAVESAKGKIKGEFIAVAGDHLFSHKIVKELIGRKGKKVAALKEHVSTENYGSVVVREGRIKEVHEKSKNAPSNLVNISMYKFSDEIFSEIEKIKKSKRGEYEITDVLPGAEAVVTKDFWMDITWPWDMLKANEVLLDQMAEKMGRIVNSTVRGKVVMEEGAVVENSVIEGNVYLGKNVHIGPFAYIRGPTSIGDGCNIGGGTTVKSSILFPKVNAKHLTYIGDSIIGENTNFGSSTQLANFRFDSKEVWVETENGRMNSWRKKLGAFVGDDTKFGVGSIVMPGKVIGNNCWIGSGVVVYKNIPSNKKIFVKQEWTEEG
ncbi:MAG: bifunctional sugar-1-phosphate nucleotidylyltransferase/acetyltransferase [Candidatus Anstonellales archaeon]